MLNNYIKNIWYSFIEKIFILVTQFVYGILLIRLLGENKVGVLAVATGAFSIIAFINISWESILFSKLKDSNYSLEKLVSNFLCFNLVKSFFLIVLSCVAATILIYTKQDLEYLWGILSVAIVTVYDSASSSFFVISSTQFKQKISTYMITLRWVVNLILAGGFFFFPNLFYAFLKDIFLLFLLMGVWFYVLPRYLDVKISFKLMKKEDWKVFYDELKNYNLWTHCTAVLAQMIYKVDALVLSFFAPQASVAMYGVALNVANTAGVVPGVISYQATVANAKAEKDKVFYISSVFFRLSSIIGLGIILGYVLFGRLYLQISTGKTDVEEAYVYMMFLVVATVIIKSLVSSMVAYVNVRASVKGYFLTVTLPTFIVAVVGYIVGSYFFGAYGCSVANVVIAVVWFFLMLLNLKRSGYPLRELLNFKTDFNLMEQVMRRRKGVLKNELH